MDGFVLTLLRRRKIPACGVESLYKEGRLKFMCEM